MRALSLPTAPEGPDMWPRNRASPPSWVRPTPARPTMRSNGCWRIAPASSACRCACWRARSMTGSSHARAVGRRAGHRRRTHRAARAAYWVCTVEAMPEAWAPISWPIDEIQLCADPERGHVFHRPAAARAGLHETLFLGADTMRSAIADWCPEAVHARANGSRS